jgi:hypothetical protein
MSSRASCHGWPVALCCASPCDEGDAFVMHEGGGRCVRGLDRPSPTVPRARQPGQAAGRIGWGWRSHAHRLHPHQQCHRTWPAGRIRRRGLQRQSKPVALRPPPSCASKARPPSMQGEGNLCPGVSTPCLVLASLSDSKRTTGPNRTAVTRGPGAGSPPLRRSRRDGSLQHRPSPVQASAGMTTWSLPASHLHPLRRSRAGCRDRRAGSPRPRRACRARPRTSRGPAPSGRSGAPPSAPCARSARPGRSSRRRG